MRHLVRGPFVGTAAVVVLFIVGLVVVWDMTETDPAVRSTPADQPGPDRGGAGGLATAETPATGAALILAENAKPGSPDWRISDGNERPRGIEGFADRVSAQQGEGVRLFVTTEAPTFEVVAYRLGFYDHVGAREVWRSEPLVGIDQPECNFHPDTATVECSNWAPSLTVGIDGNWPPGQYLFKLIPSQGTSSFVPFILRDDYRHSDVLVISAVTTLLAYNPWGGHSFYSGDPHATIGSFDRPLDWNWAQSGIIGDTYNVGMMLESMGLDVSYTTNVDQHLRPQDLKNHRVIVSGYHDEYYSLEMREGLEAARDSGVNLVFLGANAVFRRIRFADSPLGPARQVVSYRLEHTDPLRETDPKRVTTSWRDPPAARPESSLLGTFYECNAADLVADMVIVDGDTWMFDGTGVVSGQHWPGAVRREYDRVNPGVPTPPNIQVLARSPLECGPGPSYADMAYYTAPSGAGVFSSGTVDFETRLGPLCPSRHLTPERWECQLRQMMANVFTEFARGPVGQVHPSQPNLDRLGHHVSVHGVSRG
jgi:hypothetical protein